MGNDKIGTCIKNWIDVQERRLSKLNMYQVRIDAGHGAYYGRVHVTNYAIDILPDNPEILGIILDESRLVGIDEVGTKGVKLNLRFNRPPVLLYFNSVREKNLILAKMRRLISDESTSGSEVQSDSPLFEEAAEN